MPINKLASSIKLFYKAAVRSYLAYKVAQTEKLLSVLESFSPEIKQYVLALPTELTGHAISFLNKNKTVTLSELQSKIEEQQNKQLRIKELKEKTKSEISTALPNIVAKLSDKNKEWLVIQLKKSPELKKDLLTNIEKVINHINQYEPDLNNYKLSELLDEVNNKNLDGRLNLFFEKVKEIENRKISILVNYPLLKKWFIKNFHELRIEWINNVHKYSKSNNISTDKLVLDQMKVQQNIEEGLMRGQDLPSTPLRFNKHDTLLNKMQEINHWYGSENPDIEKMSPSVVIAESDKWHAQVSDKTLQYEPINNSNIVYGPDNWKDKNNNGHFILELKSINDMIVEGSLMDHCLKNSFMYEKSQKGQSRFFSLRNISSPLKPILSIETDGSGVIVRQDYGPKNSKIDKKYHDMVTEWSSSNNISNKDLEALTPEDMQMLAADPKTPIHILEQLSNSDDIYVLSNVAYNLNTPSHILEKLSNINDDDLDIAYSLSENPNTPKNILEELYNTNISNPDAISVLKKIAQNPNTPVHILEELSDSTDQYVLYGIVQNQNAPDHILEKIKIKLEER